MSNGEQKSEKLLSLAHFKSAAIKCAVELGIPTAIKRCGRTATISDLIKEISLVPAKAPYLSRLLRFLAFFGLFEEDEEEFASAKSKTVYKLTPTSRLLVQEADNDSTCDMSHMLLLFTRPSTTVSTFFDVERWIRDPTSTKTVFEAAHASMADSRFTMEVVIKEAGGYFKGLKTLTDVGGGHGAATAAIVATFPDMQCTVMDLQQVVSSAPECGGTVKFVVGNMFESIPPADVVLLKLVLHSWDDASCIKILKCCKEAIPPTGGKVFNINTVLGHRGETSKHVTEVQLLLDLYMMRGHGFERDERQWKTIFLEVGFANYTVIPLQDPLAMIVLHPSPLVVEMTVKVTGTGGAKEDSFLSTDEAEAAP
uniref:O-methyltransferase domain-containing protein n=1 Tax=Setaria viridis TaxID=4556 RepID=A0A4U6V666_SETVI|nr:hypothetical protein SEVIR_3G005100v2 [Setaria viridis]